VIALSATAAGTLILFLFPGVVLQFAEAIAVR
jgi:hypothetical protein